MSSVQSQVFNDKMTPKISADEESLKNASPIQHQKTSCSTQDDMQNNNEGQPLEESMCMSYILPDEAFQIRNLDTGELIDIRDENEDSYASNAAKVMNLERSQSDIERFYQARRRMNASLWEAVERNDINHITHLLDKRIYRDIVAQTNSKGLNNWTALHLAAADGFQEACETLISNGEVTNIDAKTSINRTPLHLACLHGHLSVVKLLVRNLAEINAIDDDGNTPLHYAVMNGHTNIVDWLLRKNPDITIENNQHKPVIECALNYDVYNSIIDYCKKVAIPLKIKPFSRTPFHSVLLHNSREDLVNKLLTKCSVKPSSKDLKTFNERPKKMTSLHSKSPIRKCQSMKPIMFPEERQINSKLGPRDFKGLYQLGKGSFGEVFLVENNTTLEKYALKVLRKEKVLENKLIKYAWTERNIMLNISHPFIVKLHGSFQTPEKLCFVMEYCPGGDLGTHIARERRFSLEKAKFYLCEIILALEELHKNEIIFRDLKPENVILDTEGHAKLTDFGLSKEGMIEGQLAKSFCGSVAYLAPEMLRRAGHTKVVDWYLVGVLLYEMLVGVPPYYSSNREQLFNNIQRGKLKIPSTINSETKDFLKELLQRDPTRRLGYRNDAKDLKEHSFLRDVDWTSVINKSVTPPKASPIRRMFKSIPQERIFGMLEDEEIIERRIEGWSFISPR